MLALTPRAYKRRETAGYSNNEHPQTGVYFAGDYGSARASEMAVAAGLNYADAIAGTPIRIASGRPPQPSATLSLVPLASVLP